MADWLETNRRWSLVALAAASALLSPPDPFAMLQMMVPLALGYEVLRLVARSCRW